MANMALNPEQRLGQKLTNNQLILWNYVFNRWPNCIIETLYFNGLSAASEFTVYAATKLYVGYNCRFGSTAGIWGAVSVPSYYNEANVLTGYYSNTVPVWDATAAAMRFINNVFEVNDMLFSRILFNGVPSFEFYGYRLTI